MGSWPKLVSIKRCGICELTRADGVVIYRGQGYCKECMKEYRQIYRYNRDPEERIKAIQEFKKRVMKAGKKNSS